MQEAMTAVNMKGTILTAVQRNVGSMFQAGLYTLLIEMVYQCINSNSGLLFIMCGHYCFS